MSPDVLVGTISAFSNNGEFLFKIEKIKCKSISTLDRDDSEILTHSLYEDQWIPFEKNGYFESYNSGFDLKEFDQKKIFQDVLNRYSQNFDQKKFYL